MTPRLEELTPAGAPSAPRAARRTGPAGGAAGANPVELLGPRRRSLLAAMQALAIVAVLAYAAHVGFGIAESSETAVALFQDWVYNLVILLAAASCLGRGLLAAAHKAAWLCLSAALACFLAGELHYTLVLSELAAPPYPALSDAFFLAFYPFSWVALVLLVPAGRLRSRGGLWLDGLIGALAIAAAVTALLFEPIKAITGGGTLAVATTLAYPAADLLLLGVVVSLLAATGWRPGRSWAFIGAGLAAVALADTLFLYQSARGTYVEGTLLDALWPAAVVMLGLAAWQPPARLGPREAHGLRVMAIPVAFALVALGLLMYNSLEPTNGLALALAAATMVAVIARMAVSFASSLRVAELATEQALRDPLTGLGNRRRLMADLESALLHGKASEPRLLVSFDLDGFKRYNDTFGHPAGDALLARLGSALEHAVGDHGRAYRLGGDEFCVILPDAPGRPQAQVALAAAALTARGEGFAIGASHGSTWLPDEAADPATALQVADRRLYEHKDGRTASTIGAQTRDVLLQVVREREPGLRHHLDDVAALAQEVGRMLGLSATEVDQVARAAELHDIGKVAIPDDILHKPGPLDEAEWRLMKAHTVIGERMLSAAPALAATAKLVRASHERWDGSGYPDGLSGEEIPLGGRIVAACDALHAMTSDRPYQKGIATDVALRELRRCAGSQFDPAVVGAVCEAAERAAAGRREPRAAEVVQLWRSQPSPGGAAA